eukprot:1220415-Prorocentrum_lima.AAC.1
MTFSSNQAPSNRLSNPLCLIIHIRVTHILCQSYTVDLPRPSSSLRVNGHINGQLTYPTLCLKAHVRK